MNWICVCTDNAVVRERFAAFLGSIRSVECFRNAIMYISIEANYGGWCASKDIARVASQPEFGNVHVLSFDPDHKGRPGFWTGANEKYMFQQSLGQSLAQETLRYSSNMIGPNSGADVEAMEKQILSFYKASKPLKDPVFGTPAYIFTGKGAGGQKDDLCLVLQMVIYFSLVVRQSEGYTRMLH